MVLVSTVPPLRHEMECKLRNGIFVVSLLKSSKDDCSSLRAPCARLAILIEPSVYALLSTSYSIVSYYERADAHVSELRKCAVLEETLTFFTCASRTLSSTRRATAVTGLSLIALAVLRISSWCLLIQLPPLNTPYCNVFLPVTACPKLQIIEKRLLSSSVEPDQTPHDPFPASGFFR